MNKNKKTNIWKWPLIIGIVSGLCFLLLNILFESKNLSLIVTNAIATAIFGVLLIMIFISTTRIWIKITKKERVIYITIIIIFAIIGAIFINSLISNNPQKSLLARYCNSDMDCINSISRRIIHFPFSPWADNLGEAGLALLPFVLSYWLLLGGMFGYLVCLIIYFIRKKKND